MVRRGEGCFATAKPKPKERGPLGFAQANEGHNKKQLSGLPRRGLQRGKGCRAGIVNLAFLAHLSPIFHLPINICILDLIRV